MHRTHPGSIAQLHTVHECTIIHTKCTCLHNQTGCNTYICSLSTYAPHKHTGVSQSTRTKHRHIAGAIHVQAYTRNHICTHTAGTAHESGTTYMHAYSGNYMQTHIEQEQYMDTQSRNHTCIHVQKQATHVYTCSTCMPTSHHSCISQTHLRGTRSHQKPCACPAHGCTCPPLQTRLVAALPG